MSLFDDVGGYDILKKVNKIFYDKIYKHPWIGQFFQSVPQEHIENQQTDLMAQAMGGPARYFGRFVIDAHTHIYITEELFQVREKLLQEAFHEAGATALLIEKWGKIDEAFKKALLKKTPTDCKPRYAREEILDFPNPEATINPHKKAA